MEKNKLNWHSKTVLRMVFVRFNSYKTRYSSKTEFSNQLLTCSSVNFQFRAMGSPHCISRT